MITTHWTLQGKGGVGKSLIASLLMQYLKESAGKSAEADKLVRGYDTDPVNATFEGYEALHVERVIITEQDQINTRLFDRLMEKLVGLPDGSHAVIDNGASSFIALCDYLKNAGALEVFEQNCHVLFHTVVTGGQAVQDTITGLLSLIRNFPGQSIIVWQNRYYGPVEIDGVDLERMEVWKTNQESIEALITIPLVPPQTTGYDLRQLFSRRRTFAEAANDPSLNLMARHRLGMFWKKMKEELEDKLPVEFVCLN
jgi:hypothetical protein